MLRVQLLGPLVVVDGDGRDLTPPGARERNGLAALAVVAPDPLSTERLAAELYRERPAADPRNAVQAMVSRLRRALGRSAGAIETTANGYRLVDVGLDVDQAERLLRQAMGADEPARATEILAEAAALWHGPSLDGLEGELIEAERLRIDALRCDAEDAVLRRRTDRPADATTDPDLVADLEAAVRAEPLRESRWDLLMLALYRAGRQADALRSFQRARGLLAEHLGLEPGPTLTALEQRILAHDPTLDQPRSSAVDTPPTTTGPDGSAAPAERLPTGTLSVLLCDVEGSVRRWEADPGDTAEEIERLHQRWNQEVEARGGIVVKSTGDGILAVFATAGDAVVATAAAMADQRRSSLAVRAALHTGSLTPVDDDYRGPVVNRCARLLDLSTGGQILVSGPTAELARPQLALADDGDGPRVGLRDLGSQWLRDVPEPMAVHQVTGPGLQATFPPLPSRDPASLPRPPGRLVGRDELVERVTGLVGEHGLVTLLGPGGIGKTSTALAVAWQALDGRPVTFVDLARVEDPHAVADRLAEAVASGHAEDDDRPAADRLADRLTTATDLVVIDNAEHVLDAVATVVEQVVAHQLKGSFLVTSRQPLGLADEIMVGVPPLEVPADGDDLATTGRSPSVELFLARARAGRPDFTLADGLLPVVAHICRRLDGIPLAIELAAGRASLLSVDDIAARLDDQLRLLRQVRSQRERRHRSLEAVVGWSVDQLSPPTREIFARLSVMAGSFGLDGLESLLHHSRLEHGNLEHGNLEHGGLEHGGVEHGNLEHGGVEHGGLEHGGVDQADAIEALDELDGASLITVESGGGRFRMLEPIRQYAAAELSARRLEESTRRAHARWIIDLARAAYASRGDERVPARARIDAESDHVLAALTWVADSGQADLAGELAYPIGWWFLTGDARLGERILRRLMAIADREADPLGWANVILGLGVATAAHPRSEVSDHSLAAIELFDQHDHPDRGLARLAVVFAQTGGSDIELPLRLLDEAERLTSSDDTFAHALIDVSMLALQSVVHLIDPDRIDPSEPVERGRRAAEVFRSVGENWALATTLAELGRLLQRLGRLEDAERCFLESIELFERNDNHSIHYVLSELGRMASQQGHHERADRYHTEALRVARLDGNDGCLALSLAGLAYSAQHRDQRDRAIELYREALDLVADSILEAGWMEWKQELTRLEAEAAEA